MSIKQRRTGRRDEYPEGVFDVTSTMGAFIIPRMTTTQRDTLTAVNGIDNYSA